MCKFKLVSMKNRHLLEVFLKLAGKSLLTFRYFNKRPLSSIKHHLVTCVGVMNRLPIVYGHLDVELPNIWLGICVAEKYCGKGYGNKMMKFLTDWADKAEIRILNLSVDKTNEVAYNMYLKYGFNETKQIGNIIIMERTWQTQ